uniref:Small ribosomal subunit protein uS5 n=1 Tax=Sciurus vulgaris TaxID=55149 RepID=A0A8D2DPZ9_SCIVU
MGDCAGFCGGLDSAADVVGAGQAGPHAHRGKAKDKEWIPVTNLGHLVKDMKIKSLEEICLLSLPIKESEIMDFFLGAIGDYNGHVGLGVKCPKEVATAVRGAIILAKLSIGPVQRGYWGNKIGKPHTVLYKVTGCCGSVLVRLIPAPRVTGLVSVPVPKTLLLRAGIDDCYTSARGCTAPLGNFTKTAFDAISKTYSYLLPDLWKETVFTKSPYQEFIDDLVKTHVESLYRGPRLQHREFFFFFAVGI